MEETKDRDIVERDSVTHSYCLYLMRVHLVSISLGFLHVLSLRLLSCTCLVCLETAWITGYGRGEIRDSSYITFIISLLSSYP